MIIATAVLMFVVAAIFFVLNMTLNYGHEQGLGLIFGLAAFGYVVLGVLQLSTQSQGLYIANGVCLCVAGLFTWIAGFVARDMWGAWDIVIAGTVGMILHAGGILMFVHVA